MNNLYMYLFKNWAEVNILATIFLKIPFLSLQRIIIFVSYLLPTVPMLLPVFILLMKYIEAYTFHHAYLWQNAMNVHCTFI